MAKTIATAVGYDTGKKKQCTKPGHVAAEGRADTRRTFSKVRIEADGSGYAIVTRDGTIIVRLKWNAETDTKPETYDYLAVARARKRREQAGATIARRLKGEI